MVSVGGLGLKRPSPLFGQSSKLRAALVPDWLIDWIEFDSFEGTAIFVYQDWDNAAHSAI